MAVLNNFNNDLKQLLKVENLQQSDIAERTGMIQQMVSKSANGTQFKQSYIKVIEALGYDIKVTYVKREKSVKEVLIDGNKKG